MAVTVGKKPAQIVTPAKPAPAPVVQAPAAVVEEAATADAEEEVDEDAADATAKEPRKTRKDFAADEAGWKAWCDYKIGLAAANVTKWTTRVDLWRKKKDNKNADDAAKAEKKAEKLIAAFVQVQLRLGIPEAQIKAAVEQFKQNLAQAKS